MATLLEEQTRSKRKKRASAAKLVTGEIAAYGSGVGHSRASKTLLYIGLGYVVAFLAFRLLVGRFLIPGVLVLLVVFYIVRPLRGIAVTSDGLLVMNESMMNGQPNKVLFMAPLVALGEVDQNNGRKVRVNVGPERIRLKRNTYESLLLAAQHLPSANVSSPAGSGPPPGWFSDPLARYQFRYWDGLAWTPHVSTNGEAGVDLLP